MFFSIVTFHTLSAAECNVTFTRVAYNDDRCSLRITAVSDVWNQCYWFCSDQNYLVNHWLTNDEDLDSIRLACPTFTRWLHHNKSNLEVMLQRLSCKTHFPPATSLFQILTPRSCVLSVDNKLGLKIFLKNNRNKLDNRNVRHFITFTCY